MSSTNCSSGPAAPPPSQGRDAAVTSPSSSATPTSHKTTSIALHSIRAAWKSLSSLSFSAARLPHLERAESTPEPSLEHRYTQFPATSASPASRGQAPCKRSKEVNSHHWTQPSSSFAQCLRRKRAKSKSADALQKIGIRLKSRSDQNLHRVCFIGGSSKAHTGPVSNVSNFNSIFSPVNLSGGSGDSSDGFHHQRSRSLERNHCNRINQQVQHNNTRSLERNHKFRVHLRSRDSPPDHPAPPPPTAKPFLPPKPPSYSEGINGSGGSLSICSSSSSSGSSTCGAMDGAPVGSFINKPPRGWLHPDQLLSEEGICYGVRVSDLYL